MIIVISFSGRKVWNTRPPSIFKLFLSVGKFSDRASYLLHDLMEGFKCIHKITLIISSNLQIKKLSQSCDLMSTKFSIKTLLWYFLVELYQILFVFAFSQV